MMYNMKTASVREMQHNLSEVLSWVAAGEEVEVVRHKKVVARLLPPGPNPPPVGMGPDFLARTKSIWTARPKGKPLSEIVSEARGER
jgi:antitoxin (DNA-binding transcriptional repressor) of toxin-antitoxin stability system